MNEKKNSKNKASLIIIPAINQILDDGSSILLPLTVQECKDHNIPLSFDISMEAESREEAIKKLQQKIGEINATKSVDNR